MKFLTTRAPRRVSSRRTTFASLVIVGLASCAFKVQGTVDGGSLNPGAHDGGAFGIADAPAPLLEGLEGGPSSSPVEGGADATACGADLTISPENCGACGHGCLGGACVAGTCQSVRIAPINAEIVVDDARVFANASGALLSLEKIADARPLTLATGVGSLNLMAMDFATVYLAPFGSPAQIYRVPKSGGGPVQMLSPSTPQGAGVAVDSTNVYFATYAGAIMTVPKGSGGGANPVIPAPQGGLPLVADAHNLYWAKLGVVSAADMHYITSPVVRGLATAGDVSALALDEDAVYFVDRKVSVRRVSKLGGASPALVSATMPADLDASTVVVDDTSVYWLSRTTNAIYRAPKTGGAYIQVAKTTPSSIARGMAIDDRSIFWSDDAGIFRLAK